MAVADLDDVELLDDASVQSQLLLLELNQDILAEVQAEDVEELLLCLQITLETLQLVLHLTHIVGILEHGAHCLLTL